MKMYKISLLKNHIENPEYKKMILCYLFLYQAERRNGNIDFSINNIIDYWGYKRTNKKGEIPDIFKQCLIDLQNENIIESNYDFNNISNSEEITIKFKKDINDNYSWLSNNQPFVLLNDDELLKLKNCKQKYGIYIDKLISLYLLIKSFMNFSDDYPCCFYSFENLMKINNLSKKTFEKLLRILNEENLIYNYTTYYTTKSKKLKLCQIYTTINCKDTYNFQLVKNNISSKLYDFYDWYK